MEAGLSQIQSHMLFMCYMISYSKAITCVYVMQPTSAVNHEVDNNHNKKWLIEDILIMFYCMQALSSRHVRLMSFLSSYKQYNKSAV